MENKKDILNHLKKTSKPEVPQGFFENFSDDLMAKISEQQGGLNEFHKTAQPSIPEGFFENFTDSLMDKLDTPQPKKGRVIVFKAFGFVSAVAASLLVMFTLFPNQEEAVTAESSNETVVEEIMSEDELVAYMDEDEIIEFIIDNEDIELDAETSTEDDEDVFYFLEEDIHNL